MTDELGQGDYSDDEIEQILGMGPPEVNIALNEIREAIREKPLLVTALVFAFGILVGISFNRSRKG